MVFLYTHKTQVVWGAAYLIAVVLAKVIGA